MQHHICHNSVDVLEEISALIQVSYLILVSNVKCLEI